MAIEFPPRAPAPADADSCSLVCSLPSRPVDADWATGLLDQDWLRSSSERLSEPGDFFSLLSPAELDEAESPRPLELSSPTLSLRRHDPGWSRESSRGAYRIPGSRTSSLVVWSCGEFRTASGPIDFVGCCRAGGSGAFRSMMFRHPGIEATEIGACVRGANMSAHRVPRSVRSGSIPVASRRCDAHHSRARTETESGPTRMSSIERSVCRKARGGCPDSGLDVRPEPTLQGASPSDRLRAGGNR